MTYVVGTHISLAQQQDKCATQAPQGRFEVGTQLIFRVVDGHLTMGRKIAVSFA